jgi:hypothetical protein
MLAGTSTASGTTVADLQPEGAGDGAGAGVGATGGGAGATTGLRDFSPTQADSAVSIRSGIRRGRSVMPGSLYSVVELVNRLCCAAKKKMANVSQN